MIFKNTFLIDIQLRVPWMTRRSNQSIVKEINPEYSLEGLVEAEAPILWPPDAKCWLIGEDPDAGKDWGKEEKGATEDEMVGWHHRVNGHELEQALGDGEGQESLVSCSPWGRKESDTTERLHFHFSLSCIREGNGNPLQCSCLENPRDGGACCAAIYGVAQSWTPLKRLSSSSSSSMDFPGSPVVKTVLPLQWAQVWFPIREVLHATLCGKKKKKSLNKYKI